MFSLVSTDRLTLFFSNPLTVSFRRLYWRWRFNKDPEGCIRLVLTRFRAYLTVTPPKMLMPDRVTRKTRDSTLAPITINNHLRVIAKVMRDERTVFPSKAQIQAKAAKLTQQSRSWSHVHNTASAMEWLARFWGNPVRIARPKKPKCVPGEALTEAEIAQLFQACRTLRDRVLLGIFADAALRCCEVARLRVKDINFTNLSIFAHGKNNKQRHVCITRCCAEDMKTYIAQTKKTGMTLCSLHAPEVCDERSSALPGGLASKNEYTPTNSGVRGQQICTFVAPISSQFAIN